MLARARTKKLLHINTVDLRQYGLGRHKKVDGKVYGGGPGMVLMAPPLVEALREVKQRQPNLKKRVVFLSPQGAPLSAKKCREFSLVEHLVLLCGHYEGVDQRVIDLEVDEEISIGDYVLTNGCLPAIVLIDAVARFIPGVIGNSSAAREDSFENQLLDCPHYTEPRLFEGLQVPDLLLNGDHLAVKKWRHDQAVHKTRAVRPDLWIEYVKGETQKESVAATLQQVTLSVSDLSKSRRYYRRVFKTKLLHSEEQKLTFVFNNISLTLVEGAVDEKSRQPLTLHVTVETEGLEETNWFIDPDGYQWVFRKIKRLQ